MGKKSLPSLKVLKPPTASPLGGGHLMDLFAFDRYRMQAAENFCVAWEAHGKASYFPVNNNKDEIFSVTKRAGVSWLHSFSEHVELDVARSSTKRDQLY